MRCMYEYTVPERATVAENLSLGVSLYTYHFWAYRAEACFTFQRTAGQQQISWVPMWNVLEGLRAASSSFVDARCPMSPHFIDVFRVSMGQALAPVRSPLSSILHQKVCHTTLRCGTCRGTGFLPRSIARRGTAAAATPQGGIDTTEQNAREHGEA